MMAALLSSHCHFVPPYLISLVLTVGKQQVVRGLLLQSPKTLSNRQNQSEESLRRDGTSQEIILVLLGNGHRSQLHVAQTECGQGHHSFHGSLFLANAVAKIFVEMAHWL